MKERSFYQTEVGGVNLLTIHRLRARDLEFDSILKDIKFTLRDDDRD